jgi:hypothetical protein
MTAAAILFIEMNAIKWAILSSKVTKAEVTDRIQDGRCRNIGTSML